MTIHAWRIVKAKHSASAFSGDGAEKFGARWNSRGVSVVYVAGSRSLAMLEILVHLQYEELLKRYVVYEVAFDDALVSSINPATLPRTWRKSPPPVTVQQIGDAWIAGTSSAVLRVPSAIVPTEFNYLLNPAHPDFAKIKIGPKQPVQFDSRLIKALKK
ncbi:MAG TPA: RES family NAD+ phosphorylase [Phycisphaerae bacterium]|nr:RES family NAD+ phosphorylase [Phycisphaerae bacterium]